MNKKQLLAKINNWPVEELEQIVKDYDEERKSWTEFMEQPGAAKRIMFLSQGAVDTERVSKVHGKRVIKKYSGNVVISCVGEKGPLKRFIFYNVDQVGRDRLEMTPEQFVFYVDKAIRDMKDHCKDDNFKIAYANCGAPWGPYNPRTRQLLRDRDWLKHFLTVSAASPENMIFRTVFANHRPLIVDYMVEQLEPRCVITKPLK